MDTIRINILEVASELANKEVEKHFNFDSSKIYNSVTDTMTEYTEEAQDIFNQFYDEFYDLLWDLKEE
jgi:type I site-specific restriction endonuclease